MRPTLYWLTSVALAAICMKAAATTQADSSVLASADPIYTVTQADPIRAILLGAGIMAMAYTYHRVWENLSEKNRS